MAGDDPEALDGLRTARTVMLRARVAALLLHSLASAAATLTGPALAADREECRRALGELRAALLGHGDIFGAETSYAQRDVVRAGPLEPTVVHQWAIRWEELAGNVARVTP